MSGFMLRQYGIILPSNQDMVLTESRKARVAQVILVKSKLQQRSKVNHINGWF